MRHKHLAAIAAEYWDDVLTTQGKVKLLHSKEMQHGLCTRKFSELPEVVKFMIGEELAKLDSDAPQVWNAIKRAIQERPQ